MYSPQNTDQEIEMQCMEAEQMIIEHDISKEQRKKKKKNKKNENPSSPIDEDEDLQGKMEEKGEIPRSLCLLYSSTQRMNSIR